MAKGKPTPDKSKIDRSRPVAYARRQKGSGGLGGPAASGEQDEDDKDDKDKAADPAPPAAEAASPEPAPEPEAEPEAEVKADDAAAIEPPPPPKGEPWPDATPQPMRPVEPARTRTEPVGMASELASGSPPAMPVAPGSCEDPTFMPGPRDVPAGHPDDPTLPPGHVPSGDSRSLRRDNEFALIYRMQTAVISRSGVVGTRGQWRVVEYPTSSSASNAYAKEVSRFVAEGFSDYRD